MNVTSAKRHFANHIAALRENQRHGIARAERYYIAETVLQNTWSVKARNVANTTAVASALKPAFILPLNFAMIAGENIALIADVSSAVNGGGRTLLAVAVGRLLLRNLPRKTKSCDWKLNGLRV